MDPRPPSDPPPRDAGGPQRDLAALLQELARIRSIPGELLSTPGGPTADHWTVGGHLEHLLRAAELNLRAIERIRGGRDDGPTSPLLAEGREILERGRIPRGASTSPRAVEPSATVDRARIEALLDGQLDRWGSLAGVLHELEAAEGRIPHPILGAFRAVDWLRFARIHTTHHREIVDELLGRA
ncbi:MAG: DinB family protein [Planctomycetota bacterium]